MIVTTIPDDWYHMYDEKYKMIDKELRSAGNNNALIFDTCDTVIDPTAYCELKQLATELALLIEDNGLKLIIASGINGTTIDLYKSGYCRLVMVNIHADKVLLTSFKEDGIKYRKHDNGRFASASCEMDSLSILTADPDLYGKFATYVNVRVLVLLAHMDVLIVENEAL